MVDGLDRFVRLDGLDRCLKYLIPIAIQTNKTISTIITLQTLRDDFHRVLDLLVAELFHLHPAGGTIRDTHGGRRTVEPGDHLRSDFFAQAIMVGRQAPAADHSATVAFQIFKGNTRYPGKQLDGAVGIRLNF